MAAESVTEEPAPGGTPPYAPYPSYKTSLKVMKDTLVPDRVDRSIWGNKFSGSVVTQMLTTYKFLGLISSDGEPHQRLRKLVAALDTDQWATELRQVIETAYAPLLTLDLEKASATQFNERFRASYRAEGETARKCMTFFLQAAREAGISLSPFLVAGSKPRASSSGGKRKPRIVRKEAAASPEDLGDGGRKDTPSMTATLLDKFPEFDPSWPDEIKKQWFSGFTELMNRTKA